ncbi:MAG: hypothetical protein ABSB67_04940 [Bryobacteraceae bacterium]
MRILHGDRAAGIVTHHVPFVDVVLNPQFLNVIGQHLQFPKPVRGPRTPPQSGQIDRQAIVAAGQPVDHSAPDPVAGGYSVDEQNGMAGPAR